MQNLLVHRVRNIEYQPSAITALAYTPSQIKPRLLACARENGNIEVWKDEYQELIIPGIRESGVIESLVWIESRLFSAGVDGLVREWDLDSLQAKNTVDIHGGSVWSMSASLDGLAVGCEDGSVRVLDIETLELTRTSHTTGSRVLSVAWHENHVVAAGADGRIRKISIDSGRVIEDMNVGDDETMVWSLVILPDGTIVAGDSSGSVTFWDWSTCTRIQSIKSHGADILCLAADPNGEFIYSSGVDRVIVQYRMTAQSSSSARKKWVATVKRRYHSHDVRALVLYQQPTGHDIVSGGIDTTLILSNNAQKFDRVKQSRLSSWPHRPIVKLVKECKSILEQRDTGVRIWSLGCAQMTMDEANDSQVPDKHRVAILEKGKLVAELNVKMTTNITAAALSSDGTFVVVSDAHTVKLFRISIGPNGTPRITKCKSFTSAQGANTLTFTPDSLYLIVGSLDSYLRVISMSDFSVSAVLGMHCGEGAKKKGEKKSLIKHLTVSADSKWLASVDSLRRVYLTNLETQTMHANLPGIGPDPVTSIRFSPSGSSVLLTTSTNDILQFGVLEKMLTDWSTRTIDRIPAWLKYRREVVSGIAFLDEETAFIHGVTFSCVIDMLARSEPEGKKRRRDGRKGRDVAPGFKRVDRFSPLMMLDSLDEDQVVVVERPLLKIMEGLPLGYAKKAFGN